MAFETQHQLNDPATKRHGETGGGREVEAMRPKVAIDTVLFAMGGGRLKCYLVQLNFGTAAGKWAFPGGLVRVGETLEEAARRELEDATGLRDVYLEQLCSFGDPSRDSGAHVVSIGYMALVNSTGLIAHAGAVQRGAAGCGIDPDGRTSKGDGAKAIPDAGFIETGAGKHRDEPASEVKGRSTVNEGGIGSGRSIAGSGSRKYADGQWFETGGLPELAYDHAVIADYAVRRLQSKLIYTDIACNLLPPKFTLAELREIYQTVLERGVDRRNFHRRVKAMGLLKRLPEKRRGAHRPATLYVFRERIDQVFEML